MLGRKWYPNNDFAQGSYFCESVLASKTIKKGSNNGIRQNIGTRETFQNF